MKPHKTSMALPPSPPGGGVVALGDGPGLFRGLDAVLESAALLLFGTARQVFDLLDKPPTAHRVDRRDLSDVAADRRGVTPPWFDLDQC